MSDKKIMKPLFACAMPNRSSGIVYNANYLIWFEQVAGMVLQQGRDYARDVERGAGMAITRRTCAILRPRHYGEMVKVRRVDGGIAEPRDHYRVRSFECGDDQVLCTGWTKHLNIDSRARAPLRKICGNFWRERRGEAFAKSILSPTWVGIKSNLIFFEIVSERMLRLTVSVVATGGGAKTSRWLGLRRRDAINTNPPNPKSRTTSQDA